MLGLIKIKHGTYLNLFKAKNYVVHDILRSLITRLIVWCFVDNELLHQQSVNSLELLIIIQIICRPTSISYQLN